MISGQKHKTYNFSLLLTGEITLGNTRDVCGYIRKGILVKNKDWPLTFFIQWVCQSHGEENRTQGKLSVPKRREQNKVYLKLKSSQWFLWSLLTLTPWECSTLLCNNSYLPSRLCSMYLVWMLARASIITRELRRVYSRVLEAISLLIKCL